MKAIKRVIMIMGFVALILLSGCSGNNNMYSKNEFCSLKGYESNSYDNWIWQTALSENADFYCVDREQGIMSKRYTKHDLNMYKLRSLEDDCCKPVINCENVK